MRRRERLDAGLLVGGMGLSAFGTYVSWVALMLHVSARHGPFVVSAVLLAALVPVALGAPIAGRLVDRVPNRRLMTVAQAAAAVAVGVAALAVDVLAVLLVMQFVVGCATAVTGPAIAALLPRLTGEARAARGYSALAVARSTGTLAGLAGGGALAVDQGIVVALLVDTATFAVLTAVLCVVRAERDPRIATGSAAAAESARSGLRTLVSDRVLAIAVSGFAVAVLLAVFVNVADVFFVRDVLHASGVAYGLIAAAWALGMIAGSHAAGRLIGQRALVTAAVGGGVGLGVALVLPAAAPTIATTVVAWLVGGACNGVQNVALQSLVSARVADGLRGRAFAGVNGVVVTANLLGTVVAGPITMALGPRVTLGVAGVGSAVSAAVALALVLPRLRAERRSPSPAPVAERTAT